MGTFGNNAYYCIFLCSRNFEISTRLENYLYLMLIFSSKIQLIIPEHVETNIQFYLLRQKIRQLDKNLGSQILK